MANGQGGKFIYFSGVLSAKKIRSYEETIPSPCKEVSATKAFVQFSLNFVK